MDYEVVIDGTGGSQCKGTIRNVRVETKPLDNGKAGSKRAKDQIICKWITLHNDVRIKLPPDARVAKGERWEGKVKLIKGKI